MSNSEITHIYLVCISDYYYGNRIFDIHSPQNRDNAYYPYFLLKNEFAANGVSLETFDLFDINSVNNGKFALLFSDIPDNLLDYLQRFPLVPKYLLINESEVIIPRNWDLGLHEHFSKIFTWNDQFVDNIKYFKTNFSSKFPDSIPKDINEKRKLCTLIAFNKKSAHPLELYSKRLEAIHWFEECYPDDFDFYGIGWDEYTFRGPRVVRALNRIHPLRRLLAPRYKTYRGRVERKLDILRQYRFSICYENVQGLSGWVTEKIFDCFFAGCVPIYWGADNVTDHVPDDCFIDKRKFPTYQELYNFMTTMDDTTYLGYLDRIESYLKGQRAYRYSAEYFAKTISAEILND